MQRNYDNIYSINKRAMQIRSDDEQMFQDLSQPMGNTKQVKESVIRGGSDGRERKNYKVQISSGENVNEMNLLENQYYSVTVLKDEIVVKKDIKRRFSDFDMLFEILFRQYKGHILPAFPENGIVSYVKSKVSLAKDDKFLRERISMVERFLTSLLNQTNFDYQSCPEIKAFLSQKQFDLFKKREKQKSQGIISTSWNKIMNYMKISKQNKYKVVEDQLLEQKKSFEQIYIRIKNIYMLLQQEKQQYECLKTKNVAIPGIADYLSRANFISESQETNLSKIRKLEFEAFCENQDYIMIIKLLQSIDELKGNQQNYSSLEKAERTFNKEQPVFRNRKKETLKKITVSFDDVLKDISRADSNF